MATSSVFSYGYSFLAWSQIRGPVKPITRFAVSTSYAIHPTDYGTLFNLPLNVRFSRLLIFLATHLYVKIIRQSNRGTGICPIIYLWLTSREMHCMYGLHCLLWRIANMTSIHLPTWMSYLTKHLLLRYLSTEVPPLTNQQRSARMAYSSSGRSNDDLVKQLTANGLITSERIAEVHPAARIRR